MNSPRSAPLNKPAPATMEPTMDAIPKSTNDRDRDAVQEQESRPPQVSNLERRLRRELVCDLEEHLYESGGSFELDHPLVRELQVHPDRVAHLNELYRSKEASCYLALKEGDWSGYVELHERPHRVFAFMEIKDDLTDENYWELLARFWVDCENAWQHLSEWKDLWNSGRSGKQLAMTTEECDSLTAMAEKITVYRGVRNDEHEEGLSWSLDREKAIWFGRRLSRRGSNGCLITAMAKKKDVHALLHRRGEQEIVVDKILIISREALGGVDHGSGSSSGNRRDP
jgi:hypothetical protein